MTMHSPIHATLSLLIILFITSGDVYRGATVTHATAEPDSGRMFDKYGSLPLKKENERLDNLAVQLKKEPQSKGYVVLYEGSEDHVLDLKARACRAIQRLVARRGVDSKHVVAMVIRGGHRKKFTVELWIWPFEASDDLLRFQIGVSEEEVSILKGTEIGKKCGRKRS